MTQLNSVLFEPFEKLVKIISKTVIERAILALHLILLCGVFGMSDSVDDSVAKDTFPRNKRQLPSNEDLEKLGQQLLDIARDSPLAPVIKVVDIAQHVSKECVKEFGCSNSKCWARCYAVPIVFGQEWCYTTKSYSQSYEKVDCTQDSDCDGCWKCATSCTV